ncbi:hypothetical protein L7F22_018631 [Adiantum nelumboides]|nr:hypothetical protein [Adiantum nelumboides]
MGHDNHTVMSPAHRRNQNPASPSASLFRRSSTFPREEPDLSWMALFRRHRFLLLMLALLAFLCTVYLYFAIKLGADNCSGLIGKDEALCRLKKPKVKMSHGHKSRRMLLNFQDSTIEPRSQNSVQDPIHTVSITWANLLLDDSIIQSVLVLGCTEKNATRYLSSRSSVSLPGIGCKERDLGEELMEFSPKFLPTQALHMLSVFDLIICEKCSMFDFINDERNFWNLDSLLRDKGFFLWILDTTTIPNFDLSVDSLQLHGWAYLSRVNDKLLWQKQ